jgi:REP element-mobilizing transposase RayT
VKYNPAKHHRHSIRLKGYNYSSAGAYFVTAVLQHRMHLFGSVHENGRQLSGVGTIARQCWEEIPLHFPHAALDEFMIMPDHMHGIIFILPDNDKSEDNSGGFQLNAPDQIFPD